MKILFSGYSPYSISGYGIQLKNIIKYLHKYNKHIDIGLICWDLVDKRQQLKIRDSEKINYQQIKMREFLNPYIHRFFGKVL